MPPRRFLWLSLLALLLASCASALPPSPSLLTPWRYADLRLLDPADAAFPSHDLLAVYLRQSGDQLHIRLDLLDGAEKLDYDLYIALDSLPGGLASLPIAVQARLAWDTLLVIPAHGRFQAVQADGQPCPGAALVVWRDPQNDAIIISLNQAALGLDLAGFRFAQPLKLQVFLTTAGSTSLADQTAPLNLESPPPAPARLLLVFRDTYPAYTPATALRRWDGAHTGPLGGRHGLYNLLRSAQAAQVPLTLLDLRNPASLSALDYAGGFSLVQQMEQSGLLVLPEALPDASYAPFSLPESLAQPWLDATRKASQDFGLHPSPFTYLPLCNRLPQTESASPEGVTLEWRRWLIASAIASGQAGDSSSPVYLQAGGSLPESAWGDPASARAAFQWLQAHPWVHVLDTHTLQSARLAQAALSGNSGAIHQPCASHLAGQQPQVSQAAELLTALQDAPDNPLGKAAWQAYQALFAPIYPAPPEIGALRANYLSQVWSLLAASRWADAPATSASCQVDPDQDGEQECVLASEKFYAQFEIANGALAYLFVAYDARRADAGWADNIHQLVGPSSQFIAGLSSPEGWNLEAGLLADPTTLPGAFAGPGVGYKPEISGNTLVFRLPGGRARKTFRLTGAGLQVDYRLAQSPHTPDTLIPLALDPWRRFSPGWANLYQAEVSTSTWNWQIQAGPQLQVRASTSLTGWHFNQSQPLLSAVENPNQDFPQAHFTPFPLAVLQVNLEDQARVSIETLPTP